MKIREYNDNDLPELTSIWNEVVKEGVAFPQLDELTIETAKEFFGSQTSTVLLEDEGKILGLYILHPNNVGRCAHIANASYAVRSDLRGKGIGEKLVRHSLEQAKNKGFSILQFNAVVANNTRARELYKRIGFKELGRIPHGFMISEDHFEDIYPYIYDLEELA